MRVDAIMTKTVATLRYDASIPEAVSKLIEHRISGLPVVEGAGRLVGMLTEGDLLHRVELETENHPPEWLGIFRARDKAARDAAQAYVRQHTMRVADIMTRNPIFVNESTTLTDVVALMEQHRIRRVPVLAMGGLVGIISRSDLVRHLGTLLKGTATLRRPDADIRADVLAELNQQPWFKACSVTLAVQDGTVRFMGAINDRSIGAALRVAAETVPGVTGVRLPIAS